MPLTVGDEGAGVDLVVDHVGPEDEGVFPLLRLVVVEVERDGVPQTGNQRRVAAGLHVQTPDLVTV